MLRYKYSFMIFKRVTSFGGKEPHLKEMIGHTAPSSDSLLAEVFWGFLQLLGKCQEICAQPPGSFHYHPYHLRPT
jgi:hypothetical protein